MEIPRFFSSSLFLAFDLFKFFKFYVIIYLENKKEITNMESDFKRLVNIDRESLKKYLSYSCEEVRAIADEVYKMEEKFYKCFPRLEDDENTAFCIYLNYPWKNFNNQEVEECWKIIQDHMD